MEKQNFIVIFGKEFSKIELICYAVTFLLVGVLYDTVAIANQLPVGWDGDFSLINNTQQEWLIPMVFFIISYLLIDVVIFGNNSYDVEKYGLFRYLVRKILVIISLITINVILKIIILTTFKI